MVILFDDKDNSFIDKINSDLQAGENIPLFVGQTDKVYSLEFEVTDIAKANAFVMNLMTPDNEMQEKLKNEIGIKVRAISYTQGRDTIDTLKEYLRGVLNTLERM